MALASLSMLASFAASQGDTRSIWTRTSGHVDASANPIVSWVEKYETYRVNSQELRAALTLAPHQEAGQFSQFSLIDLPMADGSTRKFKICESPIMTPQLEAKIGVKTYRVKGIDNPAETGRLDLGPNGFHGFVRSTNGQSFVIEPSRRGDQSNVFVYLRSDNFRPRDFTCAVTGFPGLNGLRSNPTLGILGAGDSIKTYRLAMNADGEYTQFFGGVTQALAAIATSINRINSVYELDVAVHLNMTYAKAWPDPNTDPYTDSDGGAMLGENQTETDASVGDANYDMGHVFSTGGGGVAALNSVGVSGRKAMGVTGSGAPVGDSYDIDYVAHEMGHQFGGTHTFNGTSGACGGGNRTDSTAFEPGSGTTIMAYAGICGAEDVQPHSDPYFHLGSLQQMTAWRNDPQSGGTQTSTTNHTPTANAGSDITIPRNTPFKLTASGTDPDGDTLTYCWEDWDLGTATPSTDNSTRPLFRSLNPTLSPTRFFPKFATWMAGTSDQWEFLPDVDRTMKFRVTVRDNHAGSGGYAEDEMTVTVAGAPFRVLEPSTAVSWLGFSTHTVTWDKGGSTATNVNIYLSTDGGNSYANGTATLVKANTPNDGTEDIVLPNVNTTSARIIVEGAGQGFYDVSDVNFTITPDTSASAPILTSINPTSTLAGGAAFTMTVTGSNFVPTSQVTWLGAARATTYVSATQLTATITASDIAFAQIIPIRVTTPAPGGGTSSAINFTINNPVPVVSSISPSTVTAGNPAFTLTVNGSNFVSGSKIKWNGIVRNTVYISPTKLTTLISATDIANVGSASIMVFNAAPGGGNSNSKPLSIVAAFPSALSINYATLTGGMTANAVVTLSGPAPTGGLVLSMTKTGPCTVPATLTVPAGKTYVAFTIPTQATATTTNCVISATANGHTAAKILQVQSPRPTSLNLNPSSVTGGNSVTGTFTLSGPAPVGGMNVTILTGMSWIAQVPSTVFVAAGQTSGTFTITTKKPAQTTSVGIWALYQGRGMMTFLDVNP